MRIGKRLSWSGLLVAACVLASPSAHATALPAAIAQALETNPELAAAHAGADAARAEVGRARALFAPTITASASYGGRTLARGRELDTGAAVTDRDGLPTSGYALTATQTLLTGGQRSGALKAAQGAAQAADEQVRGVQQSVMLEAALTYLDVLRDRASVEAYEDNLAFLSEQARAMRRRFELRDASATDVALSAARADLGRAELAQAQARLQSTEARYGRVIGAPPETLAAPASPAAMPDLNALLIAATEANPEVGRAAAEAQAALGRLRSARAGLAPELDVVARHRRDDNLDFDRSEREETSAVVQLSVPIFGGGVRAGVRQAHAQWRQAQLLAQAARDAVIERVSSAFAEQQAANPRLEASRAREAAARTAVENALRELALGERTVLDVLDLQQDFVAARIALAEDERNARATAYALLAAAGVLTQDSFSPAP